MPSSAAFSLLLVGTRRVKPKQLPFDNKDEFLLVLDMPSGTSLERTDAAARDFEHYLRTVPEVTDFESYVGTASPFDFNGMSRRYFLRAAPNKGDIRVNLIHKTDRVASSHEIALRLRNDLDAIARRDGVKQMVQDALQQRLDLKAAMFDAKSATDLERAARRSYWPRIDFRASAIQYGGDNPVGFPTLIGRLLPGLPVPNFTTSRGVNDWAVGLHIGVPLFDSGRRSGQIKAAAAQVEQARLAEQRLRLNVTREVQTSYAELESAQIRVKAMREAVIQAQEVLKNEQTKYDVGRTVINFVLEAEAAVLNSQSLLSQAQRSESIAQLSLQLSMGSIKPDSVP